MTDQQVQRTIRLLIALTAAGAAVRLLALGWMHPLNWDEIEYFRATDWVRQGLVPYRDFWEHHTPLQWLLFAPLSGLTRNAGAPAVIAMRWVQVPLWIGIFWMTNLWMRRAGLSSFGRWSAMAVAACSSLLMLPAIEYRVDVPACALYLAGLVLLQRMEARGASGFLAGVAFCLTGCTNLRFGPLLAATAASALIADPRTRSWRFVRRAGWLLLGVVTTAAVGLGALAATGSLRIAWQAVWADNYLGDQYARVIPWVFLHRLLVPFGVRIYGGGDRFDLAGIDLAGAVLIILGVAGLVLVLRRWRRPDHLVLLSILQVVSTLFIWKMKFVYHYHLEIFALLMIPMVAVSIDRMAESRPAATMRATLVAVFVLAVASWGAVILRGKENDLQYQDLVMREVHARTGPGAKVFDGVGWAIRRRPAYRFWFLPDLARQLVAHGHAAPLASKEWIDDPPQAIVADHNAVVWLARNPELGRYAINHYLPLWRNLWLPALSARVPGGAAQEWFVPIDGIYRLYASPTLAGHPWFSSPFDVSTHRGSLSLGEPVAISQVLWYVNRKPAAPLRGRMPLRKGDRLTMVSTEPLPIGVFLIPGEESLWFRQPPEGVTLDGELPRVTHVPDFATLFSGPTPTSFAQP